jgi:predicted lipid carrier protein YhbT
MTIALETTGPMKPAFRDFPLRLLAPVPLPVLQPLLRRIARRAAMQRPELFERLGPHKDKRYIIDPVNMPFILLLCPDPRRPRLRAYRRGHAPGHDARIAGTFLTLLNMIDGHLDGDALFFTRDLTVEGDTEAVVVLRNSLDDLDGSIADDIAASFGLPARLALGALRHMRKSEHERKQADPA